MNSKVNLSESEVQKIVYKTVKNAINEMNFFHREYREGKPEKAADVIRGNGWDGNVISKKPGEMIVKVRQDFDAIAPDTSESLPFEQLVEDLNIFYEDKGSSLRAESLESFNGRYGYFIRISKQQ